jgi:hypothetical protein
MMIKEAAIVPKAKSLELLKEKSLFFHEICL